MFNKSFGTPFGSSTGGFGTTSTFGQSTGFGTTSGGAFGTSAFGSSNNAGGLFGNTQAKPGGLFGSSTFSQPATSSTSTGFGFGTSTGTSSGLFGTASTGGGLFSSQNNAFAQNKPVGFGNFGTSTSSGGLFGTTNTTSNPFGGTSGSLFGSTSFTTVPTGTTIKFNASLVLIYFQKGGSYLCPRPFCSLNFCIGEYKDPRRAMMDQTKVSSSLAFLSHGGQPAPSRRSPQAGL